MNYYEHHLGDYAKDTAHLSILEHGVYGLLLDRYYITEKGIPANQAYRVVRARTREEKIAVDTVLEEFFILDGETWINPRAEEEIAKAAVRMARARANGLLGGRPPKNPHFQTGFDRQDNPGGFAGDEKNPKKSAGAEKFLHKNASAAPQQKDYGDPVDKQKKINQNNERGKPTGFSPGSIPETRKKAHHTPDTNHQTPVKGFTPAPVDVTGGGPATGGSACGDPPNAPPGFPPSVPPNPPPLSPGLLCRKLREAGIADPNPGHAVLLELIAAGADETEFIGAAREARARGKGFAYLIGTVRRRREEAAGLRIHRGQMPNRQERLEQANRSATAGWKPPELRTGAA